MLDKNVSKDFQIRTDLLAEVETSKGITLDETLISDKGADENVETLCMHPTKTDTWYLKGVTKRI